MRNSSISSAGTTSTPASPVFFSFAGVCSLQSHRPSTDGPNNWPIISWLQQTALTSFKTAPQER